MDEIESLVIKYYKIFFNKDTAYGDNFTHFYGFTKLFLEFVEQYLLIVDKYEKKEH